MAPTSIPSGEETSPGHQVHGRGQAPQPRRYLDFARPTRVQSSTTTFLAELVAAHVVPSAWPNRSLTPPRGTPTPETRHGDSPVHGAQGHPTGEHETRANRRTREGVALTDRRRRCSRITVRLGISLTAGLPWGAVISIAGRSVAHAPHHDIESLTDVVEPFLLQEGFLIRTSAGRRATARAYEHLGLEPPRRPQQAQLPF